MSRRSLTELLRTVCITIFHSQRIVPAFLDLSSRIVASEPAFEFLIRSRVFSRAGSIPASWIIEVIKRSIRSSRSVSSTWRPDRERARTRNPARSGILKTAAAPAFTTPTTLTDDISGVVVFSLGGLHIRVVARRDRRGAIGLDKSNRASSRGACAARFSRLSLDPAERRAASRSQETR